MGGDGDGGVVADLPLELLVRPAPIPCRVRDADLVQEFIAGFRTHLEGGGRVWLVAMGTFPLDSQRPFQDKPAPKRTAALVRSQRALHLRLMRLLYEKARATYWLECPSHEFIMPLTLILFDPAERG